MKRLLCALTLALSVSLSAQTPLMVGNQGLQIHNVYPSLKQANVKWVRYWVSWNEIEREDGVFDWSSVDSEINAILESGLKVYANIGGAPAHATGGYPAYEFNLNGCIALDNSTLVHLLIGDKTAPDYSQPLNPKWLRQDAYVVPRGGTITIEAPGILANDGSRWRELASVIRNMEHATDHGYVKLNHDGSFTYTHDGSDSDHDKFQYWVWGPDGAVGSSVHFAADEKPFCANPPHIDSAKVKRFVREFIKRYGNVVDYYGAWNEPGLDVFWPPSFNENERVRFERLLNEFTVPFTEVVRAMDPTAKTVGPECDSSYCLRGILALEKERGLNLFDILSFHPYPWDFWMVQDRPESERWAAAAEWRIDHDFKPAIDEHNTQGRPVWATEVGPPYDDPNRAHMCIDLHRRVSKRVWIKVLGYHMATFWFESDRVTPNSFWYYTKSTTVPTKRRAVGAFLRQRME